MSKYSDLAYILEYMNAKREPNKRRHKDYDDPMSSVMKMKRTVDEWHKFQKDLEKIHKEDKHKDDGWSKMSFMQKFVILTALTPVMVCFQFVLPAIIIIKILGLHP